MLRKALPSREIAVSILGRAMVATMPALPSSALSLSKSKRVTEAARCCWVRNNHTDSTSTYYDSQSGQHVPIHDENKIEAYLRVRRERENNMDTSNVKDLGLSGSLLTLQHQPHDKDGIRYSKGDGDNIPFKFFLHIPPPYQSPSQIEQSAIPANGNICFEYDNNPESIAESIHAAISNGFITSIGLFSPTYYAGEDPISVASQVANLIDNTAAEGVSITNILLAPNDEKVDGDAMVRLCEELSYLDVTGATIKSRLIVSVLGDDQLEECLHMGISKYIINDGDNVEEVVDMLRDVVEEQGKEVFSDR